MGRRGTLLAGLLAIALTACGGDDDATKVATDEVDKTSTTSTTQETTTSTVTPDAGDPTTDRTEPSSGPAPTAPDPAPLDEDPQFIRAIGDGFGLRMGKPREANDDETAGFGFEAYWRPEAPADAVDVDFGDGTVAHFDAPCDDEDDAWYEPVSHSYVDPGTYEVRVTFTTGPRCLAGAPVQSASGTGHVTIGDYVTNGPSEPTASITSTRDNEDGSTTFSVTVLDEDGWVGDVWVVFPEPSDAHHELWGFDQCVIGEARTFDVTHDFSGESGEVRVEMRSSGCDGEHAQEATRSLVVPVS